DPQGHEIDLHRVSGTARRAGFVGKSPEGAGLKISLDSPRRLKQRRDCMQRLEECIPGALVRRQADDFESENGFELWRSRARGKELHLAREGPVRADVGGILGHEMKATFGKPRSPG